MSTYMDLTDGNWQLFTLGVVYNPDKGKCIKCYVVSDFANGRDQVDADSTENVMLNLGYVITYAWCPVLRCSKLQTELSLSTTEAECITLI